MIYFYTECRIFFGKSSESQSYFFLVYFCFWLNRQRNNRLRESDFFQNYRILFIAKRIAGTRIFKSDQRNYFSGKGFFNFFSVVCMH